MVTGIVAASSATQTHVCVYATFRRGAFPGDVLDTPASVALLDAFAPSFLPLAFSSLLILQRVEVVVVALPSPVP